MDDRLCLDCDADISDFHPNRKRCLPCAEQRNARMGRAASRRRYRTEGARLWPLTCSHCGASFHSTNRRQLYCSHKCSKSIRTTRSCLVCGASFETYAARPATMCSTGCRAWAGRNGAVSFPTARDCGWCGRPIVGRNRRSLYCSDRCMRVAAQARRHAKGAGHTRDRPLALHIYERDGWVCHLCQKPVQREIRKGPLMASLDHLVPVSHPNYPGHVPWNLATSHLRCNTLRQAEVTAAIQARFAQLVRQYEAGELSAPAVGKHHRVTHCKYDHAYDPDETYRGKRYCRQCNRDRASRHQPDHLRAARDSERARMPIR